MALSARSDWGRVIVALAFVAMSAAVACGPGQDGGTGPLTSSDAGDDDAGDQPVDAGDDADAGDEEPDAGDEEPDAGFTRLELFQGPDLPPPLEVLGSAQGLGREVKDASHDAAGNLWAADSSRVYVRRAGMGAFESFSGSDGLKPYDVLSISGGIADTAWVGYRGNGDDLEDPPEMKRSGGASKLVLDGADIDVKHFVLESPPGRYSQYPNGRNKLRTCLRVYGVKTGPHAGDAWFGCNHGTALINRRDVVDEHHHPRLCLWDPARQRCEEKFGYIPAIGFTPDGDVWMGGSYGVMLLDYDQGSAPPKFWGPEPVRHTQLWDVPLGGNEYGSEDVSGLAVAADGTLWAASEHSGLARRFPDGTVEHYFESDGLPSNRIADLAIDAANGLWLATEQQGVVRIDLETGEWRRASGLPSALGRRVVFEQTAAGALVVAVVRGGVAVWDGAVAP